MGLDASLSWYDREVNTLDDCVKTFHWTDTSKQQGEKHVQAGRASIILRWQSWCETSRILGLIRAYRASLYIDATFRRATYTLQCVTRSSAYIVVVSSQAVIL